MSGLICRPRTKSRAPTGAAFSFLEFPEIGRLARSPIISGKRAATLMPPVHLRDGDGVTLLLPHAQRLVDGVVAVLLSQLADVFIEGLVEPLSLFGDLAYEARPSGCLFCSRLL